MSNIKQKRVYNLEYIEKLFKFIPLIFIFILTVVSIFITFVILESRQNADIDLLRQKEILYNQFEKKEILLKFQSQVKKKVEQKFSSINKLLQEHTYKIVGSLKSQPNATKMENIIHFLQKYESEHNLDIVLFDKEDFSIVYGYSSISFLSDLIFGQYSLNYRDIVLKYIVSQGRHNTQEWKNDLTGSLRLSFFDSFFIQEKEFFIGSFSKNENIRFITKNYMIEEINSLDKKSDYSIWLLDLIAQNSYNFLNKKESIPIKKILKEPRSDFKYKILAHFNTNEEMHALFDNHIVYDARNKLALCIEYDKRVPLDTKIILNKYNALFKTIVAYILMIAFVLILFSLVFSNFTKKILDRYNKELELRTNSLTHWKNRFELAIIASNDGLWDIDFDTEQIYFSNKWLEISGYKKGDLSRFSDWFNLIHNEDKDKVELLFEEIFASKREDFMCEYRLKTKNEGFKWILGRGKIFIDKKTNHRRMLMMSMDIDKNKRLKKELLDVELLVEDGKIVLFKLKNDAQLSVHFISNAIKNYGYQKKSFENHEMHFYDLIHPDDINIVKVALNAALSQDLKDFTFVCRALNVANEIRWISCRTLVLKDHSGNVTYFYGYLNDITKIKLSEQELKQKVEDEVAKNRQKDRILIQQSKLAAMGEMLGNIAHQWRQPLNNIFLFLQFLKDNYNNETKDTVLMNKYFDKSFTQIKYMSQTIDDFRNFYKPSKERSIFSIQHAIESTLEIIKAQLKNEDIELILSIEDTQLHSFENELKQSLLNILNNARDAILIKKEEKDFDAYIKIVTKKEQNHLYLSIENNGGQIEKEIIERVFEPYFTTKFESQGTGIGLYMTKSIIESNIKGKVEVENIPQGVRFNITLPLQEEIK